MNQLRPNVVKGQLKKWMFVLLVAAGLPPGSVPAITNNSALWRPRFATPAIVALDSEANRQFTAEVRASSSANTWNAYLYNDLKGWNCSIVSASYTTINRGTEPGWKVVVSVPADISPELFDFKISCSQFACLASNAVSVIPAFASNFYLLHMADEQIVQEFHNQPSGRWYSSAGTAEEFSWEQMPINLINPRFVIITGDQIDYNGALDGYNNWSNWGYTPSGNRLFTQQETKDIEKRLTDMYIKYHRGFRVPYVQAPGNHDVPPTDKLLKGTSIRWHTNAVPFYEANLGQRSWSLRMGDFYVLMHDWSESYLKTWANNDYNAALNDPSVKFRLIGQHYNTDQAILPSGVSLMLVGHGHTTATLQSSPYYIYEDGPAFTYGNCALFNFNRSGSGWTCSQTTSPRNLSTDVWNLYGDNGNPKKVRTSAADAFNITSTSVTITNDLPKNFYDGRVRFILNQGSYNTVTNGTILAQYDCQNGTKTAVLVKVNIPASGRIKVSMGPAAPVGVLDPQDFSSGMKITLSGYTRGSTLANFPVLVNFSTGISGFSYSQFASRVGNDLRFTDAGRQTLLFHEIDTWNTNGVSSVWVNIPQISSSTDYILAYWGNPALTAATNYTIDGSAWASYDAVWHLKESGFPYDDSRKAHPATSGTAPAVTSSGKIGNAQMFNGTSQYLVPSGSINFGNSLGLSAWVKLDPTAANIQTILANKAGGWNANGISMFVNTYNTTDGKLLVETGDGVNGLTASTTTGAVPVGGWHHVFASIDRTAGTATLYVDGINRTASAAILTNFGNTSIFNIGRLTNGSSYLDGTLDEARIEGAHSADWVWATWMNAASNSAFLTYSAVAPHGQGLAPLVQMPVVPQLAMAASGQGGLLLSWPDSTASYALYSATNLAAPVHWSRVTNDSVLSNGQRQVLLPTDGAGMRFYRLRSE